MTSAKHHNNFDFLRFAAAALVWYGHCFALSSRPEPMADLLRFESFGSLGVTIFFVISGYFVTMSCAVHDSVAKFALNRALRILPALFVVVVLSVFALGPVMTTLPVKAYFSDSETWRYLKCMLVFPLQYDLPGVFESNHVRAVNGSLWTLQHEVRLYAVIGVLGVLGILRPRLMLAVVVALFALRIYGVITVPDAKAQVLAMRWSKLELMVRLMSQFACGALLYLARDKIKLGKELFLVALAILVACFYWGNEPASALLFDLAFSYIVIYLGFLKLPLLSSFSKYGDFSYGIYLYAFPVQQLCISLFGASDFTLFLAASFSLTLLGAILSWHLVEKQALRFKK